MSDDSLIQEITYKHLAQMLKMTCQTIMGAVVFRTRDGFSVNGQHPTFAVDAAKEIVRLNKEKK